MEMQTERKAAEGRHDMLWSLGSYHHPGWVLIIIPARFSKARRGTATKIASHPQVDTKSGRFYKGEDTYRPPNTPAQHHQFQRTHSCAPGRHASPDTMTP